MKIHITLVGKQTLPVYIPALYYASEKIFLICSEETRESAITIKSKLDQIRKDKVDVELLYFDPVNIREIKKGIRKLTQQISPVDELTVNVSGGTKTWSVVFYQMFSVRKNTVCFYLDQNGFIWDFKTGLAVETTTVNVSITDLCALHNIEIESLNDINEYDYNDEQCLAEIQDMYDAKSYEFSILTKSMYETGNQYEEIDGGSSIEKNGPNSYTIDIMGYGEAELSSTHIDHLLFNTGWFEYMVARFLSKWEQQSEIFLNVKFRLIETGVEINEVDVVVRTKKKYLFVECKTSAYSPSDVDKFNDVAKNYGGIAVKRIFVTYKEPNKWNKEKYSKYETVKSKCKKLKMPFFVYKEIERNPDQFFAQLNKYMTELNE